MFEKYFIKKKKKTQLTKIEHVKIFLLNQNLQQTIRVTLLP